MVACMGCNGCLHWLQWLQRLGVTVATHASNHCNQRMQQSTGFQWISTEIVPSVAIRGCTHWLQWLLALVASFAQFDFCFCTDRYRKCNFIGFHRARVTLAMVAYVAFCFRGVKLATNACNQCMHAHAARNALQRRAESCTRRRTRECERGRAVDCMGTWSRTWSRGPRVVGW